MHSKPVFNWQKIVRENFCQKIYRGIEEACGNSRVLLKKKWNSCFQW